MSQENKVSSKSKQIRKAGKYPYDAESEKKFDTLKRKYANAIAYLLVNNIPRTDLQTYFENSEDNKRRFDTIKKIRQEIIESRPRANQWVDMPFYVKLDLSKPTIDATNGQVCVKIVLGECAFKQPTAVVTNKKELELYMATIAKIIENEKLWSDPDMADFDLGERGDLAEVIPKKKKTASDSDSDKLKLE